MANLLKIFALLITLSACNQVYFEQPQPAHKKELMNFPTHLQGSYVSSDSMISIIREQSFEMYSGDKIETNMVLGDSLVIKRQRSSYVINIREKEGWIIYTIQLKKDQLAIKHIELNDSIKNYLISKYDAVPIKQRDLLLKTSKNLFKKLQKEPIWTSSVMVKTE